MGNPYNIHENIHVEAVRDDLDTLVIDETLHLCADKVFVGRKGVELRGAGRSRP